MREGAEGVGWATIANASAVTLPSSPRTRNDLCEVWNASPRRDVLHCAYQLQSFSLRETDITRQREQPMHASMQSRMTMRSTALASAVYEKPVD